MWCVYAYMHTKEYCCLVTKWCPTLWDRVEYSLLDPSFHEIFQARIPEWFVISFSMGSSQPRYQTRISHIGREIVYCWITREDPKGYYSATKKNKMILPSNISSVQFSRSVVSYSGTPWIAARQASLSITNSWSLLKLMPIESVMLSSHLILCHPRLLLPPIPPSIRVFSNESTLRMR